MAEVEVAAAAPALRVRCLSGPPRAATAWVLEVLEEDGGVPRDLATAHLLVEGAAKAIDDTPSKVKVQQILVEHHENRRRSAQLNRDCG